VIIFRFLKTFRNYLTRATSSWSRLSKLACFQIRFTNWTTQLTWPVIQLRNLKESKSARKSKKEQWKNWLACPRQSLLILSDTYRLSKKVKIFLASKWHLKTHGLCRQTKLTFWKSKSVIKNSELTWSNTQIPKAALNYINTFRCKIMSQKSYLFLQSKSLWWLLWWSW